MSWYVELLKQEIGYQDRNFTILENHDYPCNIDNLEAHKNIDHLTSDELHQASVAKLDEIRLAFKH